MAPLCVAVCSTFAPVLQNSAAALITRNMLAPPPVAKGLHSSIVFTLCIFLKRKRPYPGEFVDLGHLLVALEHVEVLLSPL